jgi:hypothetical protein
VTFWHSTGQIWPLELGDSLSHGLQCTGDSQMAREDPEPPTRTLKRVATDGLNFNVDPDLFSLG